MLDELAEGLGDPRVALVLGLFQRISKALRSSSERLIRRENFCVSMTILDPRGDFERAS